MTFTESEREFATKYLTEKSVTFCFETIGEDIENLYIDEYRIAIYKNSPKGNFKVSYVYRDDITSTCETIEETLKMIFEKHEYK